MAQLSSPGVSVTVIDESFYTTSAPGTVPLIIVASEEGKQNGASTGTAPGTLKSNAGKVYLLTSQKDLSDTFGIPKFITDANNNPVHAGEQNEYGLQAAYSYLGISNRAYVVRADVDLAQLDKKSEAPTGLPANGTFWFNTKDTKFGIFEWNGSPTTVVGGQTFTVKNPTVITDTKYVEIVGNIPNVPKSSYGAVGSYAMVAVSTLVKLWFKKPATSTPAGWVEVGSADWAASWPVVQSNVNPTTNDLNKSTLTINTYPSAGATLSDLVDNINSNNSISDLGITAAAIDNRLTLYSTGIDVVIGGNMATNIGITAATYKAPALTMSAHTKPPQYSLKANKNPSGSIWIKTTTPNLGASWDISRYKSATSSWVTAIAPLYKDHLTALAKMDATGGGIHLAGNDMYVKYNDTDNAPNPLANFKIYRRIGTGATTIKSVVITSSTFEADTDYTFQFSYSVNGSTEWTPLLPDPNNQGQFIGHTITFTGTGSAVGDAEAFAAAFNQYSPNVVATITATNQISIQHLNSGEIKLVDGSNTPIQLLFGTIKTSGLTDTNNLYGDSNNNYIATLWTALSDDKTAGFATASSTALTSITPNDELWYNSISDEIDIMVNNGTTWVGYNNYDFGGGEGATNPTGPIVSPTKPLTQSDGSILVDGDIWINTSDLENYPAIYRYQSFPKKWVLTDKSDQTTELGILFHDARWNTDGKSAEPSSIVDLLTSDFLDFDAPDPALYPQGMLLWNLRRSGFNVKRFVHDYVDITAKNVRYQDEFMGSTGSVENGDYSPAYYPHVWVSDAANQVDGSGSFAHKAQRAVVVQALQALVNSNLEIRDEQARIFNLIACPGYPELVGEMKTLNYDRGITAFVLGDTPARLTPDATSLSNWGSNQAGAVEDNDSGLVTSDEYLAFFYPWGYSSDNLGNNIAVPPSHMMLRTIALSDNVSYPWFAPAGTRRGGITNASSVGYITSEGEFKSIAFNTGQRDTMHIQKINPIVFINGAGIVNYGQLTRAKNASALDRINVARLVIYLRTQFAALARPYLFEPNDARTRSQIKHAAEQLMIEMLGKRAIYDYIVVCDETNNTPSRIDNNELYLDVAIEPMKTVEFIYIPLRLKNTGEIRGLGA